MLSAIGFIMVIVMVALILWGKVALPPILVLLSVAATAILCLLNGQGPLEFLEVLKGYNATGASSVLNTVALFTFAIIYFNVLGDAGMFDIIVAKIFKRIGNNIGIILFMTCMLATISHLDGSGATTMLITIPTMLPLFKKMKLSPTLLVLYVGMTSGVVNMLPWTSALGRVSASTGVDARALWTALLPVQIVGLIIVYASCFIVGPMLKKKGYGMSDEEFAALRVDMLKPIDPVLKVGKGAMAFDMILTVVLVIAMLLGWINTNLAFMIGVALALLVNCKGSKEMTAQIKKHGATALNMCLILFCIGLFVGTMKDSGMMSAMTETLVGLIPTSLGPHLTFIIALLAVPLSMVIGSDALYMICAPIFAELSIHYGGSAIAAAASCTIGACIAANLCLVAPTPYLALGLAGVEMKDNLKTCFVPIWILGIVLAIVGAIAGAYPF